jgi:hypothetical protein
MPVPQRLTPVHCIALSLIWSLAGCGAATAPEEAVRLWVSDAETAVENKNRDALMAMIADGYTDSRGNYKADLEQMARFWFLRNRHMLLASKIDKVTIIGDSAATVHLVAGRAGTGQETFGVNADVWRLELELVNDSTDWLLIGARWGELGGGLR